MLKQKPVVHYKGEYRLANGRALLYPIDHPDSDNVSNTKLVMTSPIVSCGPDWVETENTYYKLQKGYES